MFAELKRGMTDEDLQVRHLMSVPGIGPIISSAIVAACVRQRS
jgi:transposase